jgi:hypothetical protein
MVNTADNMICLNTCEEEEMREKRKRKDRDKEKKTLKTE